MKSLIASALMLLAPGLCHWRKPPHRPACSEAKPETKAAAKPAPKPTLPSPPKAKPVWHRCSQGAPPRAIHAVPRPNRTSSRTQLKSAKPTRWPPASWPPKRCAVARGTGHCRARARGPHALRARCLCHGDSRTRQPRPLPCGRQGLQVLHGAGGHHHGHRAPGRRQGWRRVAADRQQVHADEPARWVSAWPTNA